MICLGIESTAHTFGIGIVDSKKKVLANVKKTFTTKKGGIIPVKAAEHHLKNFDLILKESLKIAKINLSQIDLISFSIGPGLGHTLRIGASVARSLSLHLNKPIIGVNHCISHLEIGNMLFNVKDPLLLYVSGANTQVISFQEGKYRIFGETLDIGAGNFLDCLARELNLGFPGGPKIYEYSLKGKNFIKLPYLVKGMDTGFGGLLTNLKQKIKSNKYDIYDICYSVQETIFAMLLEVTERGISHCEKNELLLGGGVCCNKRFQEMAKLMCKNRKIRCYIPENEFLVDNGVMIAWLGIKMYDKNKKYSLKDTVIKPYERTDEIKVNWK
ncbi:MAG: bifunctional N(6)-L-threonylcarbamoyladenine synthase/serine/threonine protein kinase [Nanoarchaeota archaeon]